MVIVLVLQLNRIRARLRLIKINLNGIVVFVAISVCMTRFLCIVLKKKEVADVKNTFVKNEIPGLLFE